MELLETVIRRLFFLGAFALTGLAVLEKVMNVFHWTLLKGVYSPVRLLEFAAIALLFTIAMQLHRVRLALAAKLKSPPAN
jgi:preprotein translocase subunit SecY